MSYFPNESTPIPQTTSPAALPSPSSTTRVPSRESRHSISDPPEGEQDDHRSEHSLDGGPRRRPTVRTEEGDIEAQTQTGRRPRADTRPSLIKQGSMMVKESWFEDIGNDAIAMAGEFVGTILFLVTSLGAAQSVSSVSTNISGSSTSTAGTSDRLIANMYVAFATGTALYGTASIFYRFTGSIFNPSVSLALCVCRVIKPVRFFLVCFAQMLGGVVACFILSGLLPGQASINLKLSEEVSVVQALFIEMFATTTLILTVLMLGVEKHTVTPHAPLGFGFTLLAATLFAKQYTGASINVSRAFGSSCVEGFQSYHWIYWLGPTMGALLACAFYEFLKLIKYWQVNPGQDSMEPLTPTVGKKYTRNMRNHKFYHDNHDRDGNEGEESKDARHGKEGR